MVERLLKRIAGRLDKAKIPYMVIGGQAVLLYGTPRLTRDIDITLGVDTDRFTSLREVCKRLGLRILPPNPQRFVSQTKVLPVEDTKSKIRVDFIFSFTPYERQAMKRTKKVRIESCLVKFASPEDVIIHKMFAGRAVDLEDVKNILLKRKKRVDLQYIKKWLSKFEKLSQRKLLSNFNRLQKAQIDVD